MRLNNKDPETHDFIMKSLYDSITTAYLAKYISEKEKMFDDDGSIREEFRPYFRTANGFPDPELFPILIASTMSQINETLKNLNNSINKQNIMLSELVGAVEDLDDLKAGLKRGFIK